MDEKRAGMDFDTIEYLSEQDILSIYEGLVREGLGTVAGTCACPSVSLQYSRAGLRCASQHCMNYNTCSRGSDCWAHCRTLMARNGVPDQAWYISTYGRTRYCQEMTYCLGTPTAQYLCR